jgi:hypothetical protein
MLIEIEQGRANPTVRILHAIAHGADASMCQLVLAACTDHPPAN